MIYLDNAATTKPFYRRAHYAEIYKYAWLNANSNEKARNILDKCREDIKQCLGFKSGYVLFCKSSTEASKWLMDLAHEVGLLCGASPYEHDSVYSLSDITISYKLPLNINVNYFGLFQLVNQMTGYVQDVKKIKEKYPNVIYLGCDLTATIGKYPLPKDLESYVDAVWFDAHKIHGEGNIGCIWISDKLFKLFNGSNDSRNEYGLIHGTPDVEGVMMLVEALRDAVSKVELLNELATNLNQYLFTQLNAFGIKYKLPEDFGIKDKNIIDKTNVINTIVLEGIDADVLTYWLSMQDVFVGKGASACAEAKDYGVLLAYNIPQEQAETAIRVSYSIINSKREIRKFVASIAEFKKLFC